MGVPHIVYTLVCQVYTVNIWSVLIIWEQSMQKFQIYKTLESSYCLLEVIILPQVIVKMLP